MRWLPSRQVALTILLVLLVAVAGCSGGGNGATDTEDGSADTTAGTDTTAAGADTTTAPEGESMTTEGDMTPGEGTPAGEARGLSYDWTEGESYTYESSSEQSGTTTTSWTVTDVSNGQVTVELVASSSQSEEDQTSTFTGPQGAIFSGDSQNLQALTFVIMQLPQQLVEGRSLEVGNSWTMSSDEISMGSSSQTATPQEITVEVTGTSQVAGTECYNIKATSDAESQTLNACVKEGWPFALSFSTSGGDSSMSGTIELTNYERP